MDIQLLFIEDCPNLELAEDRLRGALAELGIDDAAVSSTMVGTPEEAKRLGFGGSPTVLIDGRDAVPGAPAAAGLACRVYETETGMQGAPSLAQLRAALEASAASG